MCTEIKKYIRAKRFLQETYIKEKNNPNTVIKFIHLNDCVKILKKIYPFKWIKYATFVILHDVGRFYETEYIIDFDHASYGVQLLEENKFKDPLILLPIKYHESDENWRSNLLQDSLFNKLSLKKQKEVIYGSELLIGIDIICNMESIAQKEFVCKEINEELLKKFFMQMLGDKNDIKNEIDEVIYILCGLKLITNNKCLKYLKQYKTLDNLLSKIPNKAQIKLIKKYIAKTYNL